MSRLANPSGLLERPVLGELGLTLETIGEAITYAHKILDGIDEKLLSADSERLSGLVELANLSAIVGNLFRGGIVKASAGRFVSNTPHTYPDLLGVGSGCKDIEIKVALETNKPKGHLIKPGPHITVRYVLGEADGGFRLGKDHRGGVVWIWEVRVGNLLNDHFGVSNTEGDSGKTAVINAAGMAALDVVYYDIGRSPLPRGGGAFKEMAALFVVDDI